MQCRSREGAVFAPTVARVPFTASHVAAVLPFVRTPLIPSALVVGSMVPDLPMFFPVLSYGQTHSVAGVAVIDAAVGVGVLLVWHLLLASPLYATSPQTLRRRLARPDPGSLFRKLGWPRLLLLTYVSLVIGAATHVAWDAFTHPRGGRHIAWLAEPHGPLDGHKWAQYGSTLLGAVIVAAWVAHWWRHAPARDVPDQAPGVVLWLIPPLAGGVAAAVVAGTVARDAGLHWMAFRAVTDGIATTLTVALLLAIGWHVRRLRPGP